MMTTLSIYGAGYVGLVTGICFAQMGYHVCCMDVDAEKIRKLQHGHLPIYEENLESMLIDNINAGRIQFTTDIEATIAFSPIQMIAVGTPSQPDGSADLQFVYAVANQIGERLAEYRCIINKSTVPVGTAKAVESIIQKKLSERGIVVDYDVVSNPEFLREGSAVIDCLSPERIIIGISSKRASDIMHKLYSPWKHNNISIVEMDCASAELTKYAANAFLAMKISFMNEMSQIAERAGANIHAIKAGIGSDSRINPKFLNAGCGFGGSCFPKDVSALKKMSEQVGYTPHILNAVIKTNEQQQQIIYQKIAHYFHDDLKDKTIALWGLAFKPNTDDVRCASSRVIMELLWNAGATVKAFDPLAMKNIRNAYHSQSNLILCEQAEETLQDADALAVITEWEHFLQPDFVTIKKLLRNPAIFDGRNIYDRHLMMRMGFDYFGIGC